MCPSMADAPGRGCPGLQHLPLRAAFAPTGASRSGALNIDRRPACAEASRQARCLGREEASRMVQLFPRRVEKPVYHLFGEVAELMVPAADAHSNGLGLVRGERMRVDARLHYHCSRDEGV